MFLKSNESQDPLVMSAKAIAWKDPTGSGKKWDRKWLLLPVVVLVILFIAAAVLLPKPNDRTMDYTKEELNEYFLSQGMIIYDSYTDEDRKYSRSDPYGGYLWADGFGVWYMGSEPIVMNNDRGYSYSGEETVWCGFYDEEEQATEAAEGLSDDGGTLASVGLSGPKTIGIGADPNRRIYRYKNMIAYYAGGKQEIYDVLENLCGEPIADGRLESDF